MRKLSLILLTPLVLSGCLAKMIGDMDESSIESMKRKVTAAASGVDKKLIEEEKQRIREGKRREFSRTQALEDARAERERLEETSSQELQNKRRALENLERDEERRRAKFAREQEDLERTWRSRTKQAEDDFHAKIRAAGRCVYRVQRGEYSLRIIASKQNIPLEALRQVNQAVINEGQETSLWHGAAVFIPAKYCRMGP